MCVMTLTERVVAEFLDNPKIVPLYMQSYGVPVGNVFLETTYTKATIVKKLKAFISPEDRKGLVIKKGTFNLRREVLSGYWVYTDGKEYHDFSI